MNSLWFAIGVAAAAVYFLRWAIATRRRNEQSWEAIASRLQPGWDARQLSESATPEERWQQVEGARGLWAMHQNARVMLQMADYAQRNSAQIDPEVVAALRSDATHIRVLVLCALTQYAMHQLNERIGTNALRAATMYREMSERMNEMLQVNSGGFAAQFSGA